MEELLELVRRDKRWNDEAARKQLVKIFDAPGPEPSSDRLGPAAPFLDPVFMSAAVHSPGPDDLPETIPVFPLPGALLLPHGHLPLNIFEPRYLNLTADALGQGRMMGMVQPVHAEPDPVSDTAELYRTGCLGRITSFAETDDGRFLITAHRRQPLPHRRRTGKRAGVPAGGGTVRRLRPRPAGGHGRHRRPAAPAGRRARLFPAPGDRHRLGGPSRKRPTAPWSRPLP